MGRPAPFFKWFVAAWLAAAGPIAPAWAQDAPIAPPADAAGEQDREAALLQQLSEAESADAAALIVSEIRAIWSRSGSATIDLLVRRGQDALQAGTPEVAIDHFTAAIDHDPGFADAFVGRASAYYLTGRIGPAIEDLRHALALNPNHFEALQGFAVVLEELGRPEDALEVWRCVADINPQNAEAKAATDRLALSLEGRAL